jgi:ferrochelatase
VSKATVVLVSFGGPCSLDEVPQFMRTLTGCELAPAFEQSIKGRYRSIGGCSPLPRITAEQAEALRLVTGDRFDFRVAFRYSRPTIEETINDCFISGVERLCFFIMTPFDTSRTTGNYIKVAETYLGVIGYDAKPVFIHGWYSEPLFVDCWTQKIREEGYDPAALYLFSAHSLPEGCADEPYRPQIEEAVRMITGALSLPHVAVGWQSVPRNSEEPWFGPSVEKVLDEAASRGFTKVIQVPVGFIADHLETLCDIDQVHHAYAAGKGMHHALISSLNTYPPFIRALGKILEDHLRDTP